MTNLLLLCTRTPAVAELTDPDGGKTAHYLLRWLRARAEAGLWSETSSATIWHREQHEMASPTPNTTELLQRLAEIEKRASGASASLDPDTAKAVESELRTLLPQICAAAGVSLDEVQQSPPWFPPQSPTKAYFLQYARVFVSVISIANVAGPAKVVSEARKTAFEALQGVFAFLRAALQ